MTVTELRKDWATPRRENVSTFSFTAASDYILTNCCYRIQIKLSHMAVQHATQYMHVPHNIRTRVYTVTRHLSQTM